MTAYLRGMRDAAELALQFKTGAKARDSHDTAVKPEHSWCLDMIGVHSEYQTATGRGIKVAVLDTGLDFRHPDFRTVPDENTASYVVGEDAQDGHGHGTHCAGIIAGAAASTGGIRYGVAPNVELLVAKVLNNRSGEGYDDLILSAIDWAADMGARVISMSFGSPRTTGTPHDPVYEVYAKRLRIGNPGVLLIAAAGNGSNRPHSAAPIDNPAACPSIFAVGAIDRQKRIAPFSCCGGEKDHLAACAPGVAVHSAWVGGGFHVLSGTSMATPHVAAVAALHLEGSTSMNAGDLWQRLQETSVDLGPVADYGRGLVQAPAIQR